jgi:hypothetical protein
MLLCVAIESVFSDFAKPGIELTVALKTVNTFQGFKK